MSELNSGLTREEEEVIEYIAQAWNKFSKLEVQHPSDLDDFADSIHNLQKIIGMRALRRDYPKYWISKKGGNKMAKVFLGGTCASFNWREELIKKITIDYFNPIVPDWTLECQQEEVRQRELCDYCLCVITPEMHGVYSIAEVVDDSNKRPKKTIYCLLEEIEYSELMFKDKFKFNYGEMKSLNAVGNVVEKNGGKYFKSLQEVAEYLNRSDV